MYEKLRIFVLSLCILSVIVIACQSNESVNISKVSISISSGFGKVNANFFGEYEDNNTLDIFNNAFASAVKREGIVDMTEPEFDLKVIYTDGTKQGYHLWLGEKGQKSALMKVDDTHVTYAIPEEITDQLINLLK